jgi:hypothetical protein
MGGASKPLIVERDRGRTGEDTILDSMREDLVECLMGAMPKRAARSLVEGFEHMVRRDERGTFGRAD